MKSWQNTLRIRLPAVLTVKCLLQQGVAECSRNPPPSSFPHCKTATTSNENDAAAQRPQRCARTTASRFQKASKPPCAPRNTTRNKQTNNSCPDTHRQAAARRLRALKGGRRPGGNAKNTTMRSVFFVFGLAAIAAATATTIPFTNCGTSSDLVPPPSLSSVTV